MGASATAPSRTGITNGASTRVVARAVSHDVAHLFGDNVGVFRWRKAGGKYNGEDAIAEQQVHIWLF